MNIEWNKVTWYSKFIAVLLFIITFWVAFILGFQFREISYQKNTQTPAVTELLSGDLVLKVGQNKSLGNFNITLDGILSDSRCPVDVQCIWAGNVNSKITLSYNGQILTREISSDQGPIDFEGFKISIKSVSPEINSKNQIKSEDYILVFHIEK